MLVLVIDTATPAVTAALVEITDADVPRMLGQRATVNGRAHGELLAPQIDAVLDGAGVKPRDLAAVVAGLGPGPFTGLRVGLVTAATLSMALDIPTYGVGTLDALGAAVSGPVLVATDARRKEIYWAVYAGGAPLTPAAVNRPAEVVPLIAGYGVQVAVGEGAQMYADVLGVPVGELRYPPAEQLARLAAARVLSGAPSEHLTPLYLRRPDAVEASARKPALAPSERR